MADTDPLYDATSYVWIERKMTSLSLNSDDTLRRDHAKLTPVSLAKIMSAAHGLVTPFDALKRLPPELQDADWAKVSKNSWSKGVSWKDA